MASYMRDFALRQVIRAMYSSPPGHGAAIATAVLSDKALFREWEQELKGMAGAHEHAARA